MVKKKFLKRLLCLCTAAALACGIPEPAAMAKNGYYDGDMFEDTLNNPDETYKGLQGASSWNQYTDSTGIHGISHTFFNVYLDECILPGTGSYKFEGDTFNLRVSNVVKLAQIANQQGMTCSIQFMLRWNGNSNTAFLVDEASREQGHQYYAPATSGRGQKAIRAFWECLMKELAREDAHIDNFILGNEVNMPNAWHYSATADAWTLAGKYASSFYDMYKTVRQYSDYARCSVCVDHSWNHNDEGRGVGVKDFLNCFDSQLKRYASDIDWCVSAHLYPALLYNAEIWTSPHGMDWLTTDSADSAFVDGSNLAVMTNYIKENFGEEHRVMLTEQGFTQAQGDRSQAAAIAYTYYAAKYDPMVDCFILHLSDEGTVNDIYGNPIRMNFNLSSLAEEVYSRIGSPDPKDVQWIADRCLPVIGVGSWEEIIPYYGVLPEKIDYSAVYDMDYYYNNNPDVAAKCGYNDKALLNHFVESGMAEGRVASPLFNLKAYKAHNPDLVSGFGNDNKLYYIHYIKFGKAEGRIAVDQEVKRDYSSVFNANYYYSKNSDVATALGNNPDALLKHFVECGMAEGRPSSEEFDLAVYKEMNQDLVSVYGNDNKSYYLHYIDCGKSEGRIAVRIPDYSIVFNAEYYGKMNQDVVSVVGSAPSALLNHFIQCGMAEGRPSSEEFDLAVYKEMNQDLVSVYGNDNKSYYLHYIDCGKKEGRIAVRMPDYSAVFDAEYYGRMNQDVVSVVGSDPSALLNHFIHNGMEEGRLASERFDLAIYKEMNQDLVAIYGNDNKSYYLHYINYGMQEGRIATGGSVDIQPERDYSAVFDAGYYADINKDVRDAVGSDAAALLRHFVEYGMAEGRCASEEFDLAVYKAFNGDLVAVYGDDNKSYYIHYIDYGKAEGRIASNDRSREKMSIVDSADGMKDVLAGDGNAVLETEIETDVKQDEMVNVDPETAENAGVVSGMDSGIGIESNVETGVSSNEGVNTEAGADFDMEMGESSGDNVDMSSEENSDVNSDVNTDLQAGADSDEGVDTSAEANSNVEVEADAKVNTEETANSSENADEI